MPPPSSTSLRSGLIQTVEGSEEGGNGSLAPGEEDEEEIEWYFDQQLPQEEGEGAEGGARLVPEGAGYGFGFLESGVFSRLTEECQEILCVRDPDRMSHAERRRARHGVPVQSVNSALFVAYSS